jgi:hypothetical protein
MIDRIKLFEELKLRENVRKLIQKKNKLLIESLIGELQVKQNIRQLLNEIKTEDEVPHGSTGINVLEDLLKKVIPTLETDYKMLTTDKAQRDSYRAHIITAVQNALVPADVRKKAPGDAPEDQIDEVKVNVGGPVAPGEPDIDISNQEDAFIDIKNTGKPKKDTAFTDLPGQDMTGRNVAFKTFEKIEKNIIDSYSTLDNEEDETIFYDYLLVNLKLYFDNFEDELQTSLEEPTNSIYEKEKENTPGEDTSEMAPT